MGGSKFICGVCAMLMCGVIFGAESSEAGKTFTVLECIRDSKEPFTLEMSQKDMAARGWVREVVGEFRCDEDDPRADAAGATNACYAMWCHYTQPKAMLDLPWMAKDSKAEMQRKLANMTKENWDARDKERHHVNGFLSFPEPFDSTMQGGSPIYYLIAEGPVAYFRDKNDKLRVDPDKTKLFGRPLDHAAIGYMMSTVIDWDDALDEPRGRAISAQHVISPGYLLFSLFQRGAAPYMKNPKGEIDLTNAVITAGKQYWLKRATSIDSGNGIVQEFVVTDLWTPETGRAFFDVRDERTKSVLANPVSAKPKFLSPELNNRLAKLNTCGLIG